MSTRSVQYPFYAFFLVVLLHHRLFLALVCANQWTDTPSSPPTFLFKRKIVRDEEQRQWQRQRQQ